MGVRAFMTMWSKERASASAADVSTQRAQAEIDVIALLRSQLDVLRISDEHRTAQTNQMRKLIDQQAADLRVLNVLVQRLNVHVNKMERLLMQHNIDVPNPPEPYVPGELHG